jgi:heme oxygenase
MTREYPRRQEEEARNINQVTDPALAHIAAQAERPIRDLSRDPKAIPEVKALKSILDQEAERKGGDKIDSVQELFQQPISVIESSSQLRTNASRDAASALGISTVGDLTKVAGPMLVRHKWFSIGSLREIESWLEERGLRLAESKDWY